MQVHPGFVLVLSFVLLGFNCDWATAEKIRVASSSPSLTARLPHMVALEEGYFTREGLEVESIVVRNDATILAALTAGEFTFVETGAPRLWRQLPRVCRPLSSAGFAPVWITC